MAGQITDFTTGDIRKSLIKFSIPFFLTNLIQSLYNIADIMVVGHFCGSAGIAGASISGSVTMVITYTIIGLCNGAAIMTAQYAGRKSEKDIKETIGTSLTIMLILSAFVTVFSLILSSSILRAINTPDEVFGLTKSYFTICMTGSVFIFGYNAVASILRGMGDSKTPMYIGIGSCLLNILLDLLFVGVFGMNVSGAASATVASQAASLVACVIYLKRSDFIFDFKMKSFKIIPSKAAAIFRLGLPGAVQNMIVSGGFLIVSSITNSLGVYAASGVAVAAKINNLAQMPAGAIGMAVSSMVGQNVGAENYDRARSVMKNGIVISLMVGAVAFVIVQTFPMTVLGFLTKEAEVLEQAAVYLRVTSFDYMLVAFVFPLNGLCNGSGHTLFTMIPSIFSSVIARVPVALLCAVTLDMGLKGIGISTPTGTISAIIICGIYYFSNRWCKRTF